MRSLLVPLLGAALFALSAPQTIGESTMTAPKAATLELPGTSLYYETRGTGPLLLVIPGGPQDAGVFTGIAELLADRYTVVTYDPRGNSRSPFTGPFSVDQQADDAAALIAHLGGPAHVFGTSGGAQIGLNLAARHPAAVATLVAHEPPALNLLDDPTAALAADQDLYDTYKRDGVDAAMEKFFTDNALDGGAPEGAVEEGPPEFEMSPEEAETFGRVSGNFEYWLAEGMLPLSHYVPDIATLRAGKPKIVIALGEQSKGQMIYDVGVAVASKLGIAPTPFLGDHMGFEPEAPAFAAKLDEALRAL